jgi:bifunctional DNA-binding transcriptional regulator/antitoxin component of YhaV-PrlF toxin-antitoxin module
MRFRATLESNGKTATGIHVPDEVVDALGAGRKPAVRVTVAGHTYRSTIASRSGRYLVGVSAENRERAGVVAGDELDIDLELDTEPREVVVPAELMSAFAADAEARRFFHTLTPSQQQWYVLPIEQAKAADTRERRVAKAIGMLREGRKR